MRRVNSCSTLCFPMTQMEQVVNVHMGEAILDGKKPEAPKAEALKVEAIRTNGESTVPGGKFLP
jgi:hypothetical protein